MRPLRAVVIDDEAPNIKSMRGAFRIEFKNLGVEVLWAEDDGIYQTPVDVRDYVLEHPNTIDFAIIDLFFREREDEPLPGEPEGYAVVRQIRQANRQAFILLATGYAEKDRGFINKGRDAGADVALTKQELRGADGNSFKSIAKQVVDALRSRGVLDGLRIRYNEREAGVLSLLESLGGGAEDSGRRVLSNLTRKVLEGRSKSQDISAFEKDVSASVTHLRPGYSGAHVCRLDVDGPPPLQRDFLVLKISRDREGLERELLANHHLRAYIRGGGLAQMSGDVYVESSGFCAIAGDVVEGADSLDRWLLGDATAEAVGEVAKILFVEYLFRLYSESITELDLQSWLAMSSSQKVKVDTTIERLLPALRDSRAGGRLRYQDTQVDILRRFMDDCHLPWHVDGSEHIRVVGFQCFGDLHSGNVLVGSGVYPRPILIDASGSTIQHWSTDIVRLVVDLFMRYWRAGVSTMVWTDLAGWRLAAKELCPWKGLWDVAHGDGTGVSVFVSALIDNVRNLEMWRKVGVRGTDAHWQWHVGIGREFLRQSSHVDVTAPRAALGLLAATDHLRLGGWYLRKG